MTRPDEICAPAVAEILAHAADHGDWPALLRLPLDQGRGGRDFIGDANDAAL